MGGDGPSMSRIKAAGTGHKKAALLVNIESELVTRLREIEKPKGFAGTFGEGQPYGTTIVPGDVLQIAIFESPPALLFGSANTLSQGAGSGQRNMLLPEVEVDSIGMISVPFAGIMNVRGKSPHRVAMEIVERLRGKAHQPQAVVTVRDAASVVTVVGQVKSSTRMPLTFKGERILDAVAAAGGASEPVDKVSLQITREGRSAVMPLDEMIASPAENIFLQAGDVVTVSYQPKSFTVLGATGRNDEIKFEARGISLAQALGRIGGLRDDRANPGGMFIFRLEDKNAFDLAHPSADASRFVDSDGKIPVIYRANLRDPATFFSAQHFQMRDGDVVFVTNALVADLQKFINIIGAAIYPVVTVQAAGL